MNADLGAGAVVMTAGKGQITAGRARFAVEQDRDRSCVTCLEGGVKIAYGARRADVAIGQQLIYTNWAFGQATAVDTQVAAAWTRGKLIFHHTPLGDVVRQVNRYRPGRVMIGNPSLVGVPINGVFYTENVDDVILQIEQVTGAHALVLPGGALLLA